MDGVLRVRVRRRREREDRAVARFDLLPDESQVWIDGSSSVHPVRATATGLVGWFDLAATARGVARAPGLAGEVRIEVGRLRSGNPLVDRETRRRVDAKHHPEIVGTVTAAERIDAHRLRVTGDIAFRGEVQTVTGELAVDFDGDRVTLDGSAVFDVRDWGLQPPRVALLQVHPEVDVRIHVVAERGTATAG
ncbi:MAG: YceI family protein [Actinobacteria bacterium]|nr:YceI family protein [Actinomycetota bacterium]